MHLIPLPAPLTEPAARALERRLLTGHGVVVPVTCLDGWRWVRVSASSTTPSPTTTVSPLLWSRNWAE
jgi:hypothetical protein